jgi:DNA repair protein RadA/Sms
MSTGIDFNRVALILAVLEKRLGLRFSANDVYLNVIGGLRIEETASDMGMALALISSIRDIEIPDDLLCFGELGLSGECRAVMRAEDRIKESARLGFRKIVVPYRAITKATKIPEGVEVIAAKSVFDLLPLLRKKEN